MLCLALDLSSSTGYALFEYQQIPDPNPILKQYGVLANTQKVKDHGPYPWSILFAVRAMADKIQRIVKEYQPNVVVIEEIELGRQRIVQKFLASLHYQVLQDLKEDYEGKVFYISSSEWRRCLGAVLTKEDKKQNARLSKAKSEAKKKKVKLDKKALGIAGRFDKKKAALRWCQETYGMQLRSKDDDIADAAALGTSYIRGARICDGR